MSMHQDHCAHVCKRAAKDKDDQRPQQLSSLGACLAGSPPDPSSPACQYPPHCASAAERANDPLNSSKAVPAASHVDLIGQAVLIILLDERGLRQRRAVQVTVGASAQWRVALQCTVCTRMHLRP